MTPLPRRNVQTPSGTVAYAEAGEGPVALFVHGVIVNADLWRHQLDELADVRRCIAVDLLGHGQSEAAEGADVSFVGQAAMLAQVLDALGVDQVDLVANDSGTGIAQVFAVTHPERLRSLVLTNGDVHDNWPPSDFAGFLQMVADGGLSDTLQGMLADPGRFRAPDGLGGAYQRPDEVADATVDAYVRPVVEGKRTVADLERFILAFDCAQTVAIESQLAKLDVPTLVVWGTGDVFFDRRWAAWLAETVPGVRRTEELDGATLLFPEERPAELNALVREHWTA